MGKEFMRSSTEGGTGQEGDASLFSEGLCALDVRRYMTGSSCQAK
jgi:hypothetical protein